MSTKTILLIAIAGMAVFIQPAGALIFTGGADPIEDHGWPTGSVEMANLPTRVSWWAGPPFGTGSMYEFQYECENTDQFNKAMEVFAKIKASRLELVIHTGPKPAGSPEGGEKTDWTFTIWNPEDFDRLNNSPHNKLFELNRTPVPAPRIDLYTHDEGIKWKDVKVPEKVLVTDKRPGSVDPKYAGAGLLDLKVVDISTGQGICSMNITLRQNRNEEAPVIKKQTDPAGKCRIANIPKGYYEILIEGYKTVSRRESFNNLLPTYEKITVPMSIQSKLAGIVTDTHGTPVKGVKMTSREFIGIDGASYPANDIEAVTDSNGRFELNGAPAGFCTLRCSDRQWHMTESIFDWYPVPGEPVKITLESTATVRGSITIKDGSPIEGTINMNIEPAEGETIGRWGYGGYIPKDGKFEIKGIPPDEYRITAHPNPSPGKYEADERVMKIEGGRTYILDIVLEKRKK